MTEDETSLVGACGKREGGGDWGEEWKRAFASGGGSDGAGGCVTPRVSHSVCAQREGEG